MAKLVFTDTIGLATLQNNRPAPANRFANWTPDPKPVGDAAVKEGNGALVRFRLRDDYCAALELRGIRAATVSGTSMLDIAARLVYHLRNGGTCEVHTEDDASRTYTNCGLAEGADAQLTLANPRLLEYTFAAVLVNLDGAAMTAHYGVTV